MGYIGVKKSTDLLTFDPNFQQDIRVFKADSPLKARSFGVAPLASKFSNDLSTESPPKLPKFYKACNLNLS